MSFGAKLINQLWRMAQSQLGAKVPFLQFLKNVCFYVTIVFIRVLLCETGILLCYNPKQKVYYPTKCLFLFLLEGIY